MAGGIEFDTVLRFVDIAVDALSEARVEIDALNVYPVPDGDTGTNMYLTIAAARDAIREVPAQPSGQRWRRSRAEPCSARAATRG